MLGWENEDSGTVGWACAYLTLAKTPIDTTDIGGRSQARALTSPIKVTPCPSASQPWTTAMTRDDLWFFISIVWLIALVSGFLFAMVAA